MGGELTHRLGSVRVRMTLAAVAVVAVGLTGAGFAVINIIEQHLVNRLRDSDTATVETIAQQVEQGRLPSRIPVQGPSPVYLQILTVDGDVLAASPNLVGVGAILRDGRFVLPDPAVRGFRITFRLADPKWEVVTRRVASDLGPLTVVAASPLTDVERSIDTLTDALVITVPIAVGLVGLLAWSLIGQALRPIEAIRAQVDEIGGTTIDRRVPEPGTGDEVDRLARTMNVMLDRLQAASERQRRFVADASHELRSPVSTIRTELEVALRQAGPERPSERGTEPEWPAIAERVLAEDERLEHLIADLLELARIDEGTPAPTEDVDLDDALLDAVGRLRGRTSRDVLTNGVAAARVQGNRRQLDLLLRNLLDNAARHATNRVAVGLEADGRTATLTVEDDGSGIPVADRERVFERFTRLEEGRSRDRGGSGLGLALVHEIVNRHHGTVRVEDSDLGGARFVVTLPLEPSVTTTSAAAEA
jgi:signal transduction histidine kinase